MDTRKHYPISKLDPNDTKIELNCRTVKPILLYFEEKYGREKLEEFIIATRMNLEYLENRNNWVSYDYFCRLLEKLVEYTGDPRAPFKAGTFATRKECFDVIETFLSRLGNPAGAYRLGVEIGPRYTKIGELKMLKLKRNSCVISATYYKKYGQTKNNCLNLQGIFASIPTFWGLPMAKVKEKQCAVEGAGSCVYQFIWQNKPSHLYGLIGFILGCIVTFTVKLCNPNLNFYLVFIILTLMGYLAGRIGDYKISLKDRTDIGEKESRDLIESLEAIEKLNMELQKKVEERTEELNISNDELKETLDKLKKSQTELIQSEKMASVGRLAAGMAHELNNPVGAIRNFIQDVLEDTPEDDPRVNRLKRAEKATGRCKRIVMDLLTFARETRELKMAEINEMIRVTVSNAKEEMANPDITLSEELTPGLPQVKVDSRQLQQVLMNIIMNAADAIKGKGKITIRTRKDPGNIIINISDTGEGIPEGMQDKIFDPFFTTKAPGKGQGLGLAISYNIIKRFGGDMSAKSKSGEGTTFTIMLPLGEESIRDEKRLRT